MFLRGLDPEVNKADVYELVSQQENPKRVLFSEQNRTAHVLLPDRSSAILAFKGLSEDKGFPEHFGSRAQASLMLPLKGNEIYASALKYEKHLDKLKEQNYIVDQEVSSALVDMLIRAKSVVVVDFHLHQGGTVSLEMFPCRYPCLKFNVSFESVSKGGLGELLASPDVVKVVTRIDTNNVYAALRACSTANFRPANFFDLNLAHRVMAYWEYGQSIFMSPAPGIKVCVLFKLFRDLS